MGTVAQHSKETMHEAEKNGLSCRGAYRLGRLEVVVFRPRVEFESSYAK